MTNRALREEKIVVYDLVRAMEFSKPQKYFISIEDIVEMFNFPDGWKPLEYVLICLDKVAAKGVYVRTFSGYRWLEDLKSGKKDRLSFWQKGTFYSITSEGFTLYETVKKTGLF